MSERHLLDHLWSGGGGGHRSISFTGMLIQGQVSKCNDSNLSKKNHFFCIERTMQKTNRRCKKLTSCQL